MSAITTLVTAATVLEFVLADEHSQPLVPTFCIALRHDDYSAATTHE